MRHPGDPLPGSGLVSLRRRAGLSQEALAELSGISVRSIRGIENGSVARPRLISLRYLGAALGLDPVEQDNLESSFGHAAERTATTQRLPIPQQLPRATPDFVGRDDEVRRLVAALRESGATRTGRVAVIYGPGGVGKTTLAVEAARVLLPHFPDGQLYVPLGGQRSAPSLIADQIFEILFSFGITPERMPPTPQGRANLYRSLSAGKRMLVVIDDLAGYDEAVDLIPTGPESATIITTRPDVPEAAAAVSLRLREFSSTEASSLLRRVARRTDVGTPEWDRLADVGGRLPLAMRVLGYRLASRPDWTPLMLADRVLNSEKPLEELAHGSISVERVLRSAYESIADLQSGSMPITRALRHLAVLPTPYFSTQLAAEVLRCEREQAADAISLLVRYELLEVVDSDSFKFHDLVSEFARQLNAASAEPADASVTIDALGTYLAKVLRRAAAWGLVRPHLKFPTAIREGSPEERDRINSWVRVEYPILRSYVSVAVSTEGIDLDLMTEVSMYLLDLASIRSDWDTWNRIARSVADRAWREGMWWQYAWAQGAVAFSAAVFGESDALKHIEAGERVANKDFVSAEDAAMTEMYLAMTRGTAAQYMDRPDESEPLLRAALRAPGTTSRPVRFVLLHNLATTLLDLDRPLEAVKYLCRSPDQLTQMGPETVIGFAYRIVQSLTAAGQFAQAEARAEDAIALARTQTVLRQEVLLWQTLAQIQHATGRPALATASCRFAIASAREIGREGLADPAVQLLKKLASSPSPGSIATRTTAIPPAT